MNEIVNLKEILEFRMDYAGTDRYRVLQNTVIKNGIRSSAFCRTAEVGNPFNFSISLKPGKITDQKKSGRCWIFAALNILRLRAMEKLNLENIELSQSYLMFWDKLEKSNYFLENILETAEENGNSRILSFLLSDPLADGGQWDMFANLIAKYGVIPKELMPESSSSSETDHLNQLLTAKLRGFACELRVAASSGESPYGLRLRKKEMLNTIYRMLCISLGEPPGSFCYEARDKEDHFIRVTNITPSDFYEKYIGLDLNQYVSIINAPTGDKPYYRSFTVKYLGNIREGKPVRYLNLPVKELKDLAIRQLKQGESVWFGSDVGQFSNRESGILAMDLYDYEGVFCTDFPMNKAERLDYSESLMTHAMVLTGVNIDDSGRPNRWRVENSWGEKCGKDGFFVMSDDWFDQYTYQIVIHKKHLSLTQLEAFDSDPILLEPWDPMGSLAE